FRSVAVDNGAGFDLKDTNLSQTKTQRPTRMLSVSISSARWEFPLSRGAILTLMTAKAAPTLSLSMKSWRADISAIKTQLAKGFRWAVLIGRPKRSLGLRATRSIET